jgi:hypothetical protein
MVPALPDKSPTVELTWASAILSLGTLHFMPVREAAARRSCRDDGDQQMGVEPAAGVDQVRAVVDQLVVKGLDQRPGLTVDVFALDDQPQGFARTEVRSRRQDLDVERDDLAPSRLELALVGEDRLARG